MASGFIGPATLFALLVILRAAAGAQDFPVVTYTSADGLPHDSTSRAIQDERGFLWFGTGTAIARFDGHTFTSYGRPEGLDVGTGANDLRVDGRGNLWVATNGAGIVRFNLSSTDRSRRFAPTRVGPTRATNRVNSIVFASGDRIWAGTDAGLFVGHLDRGDFTRIELPLPAGQAQDALQVPAVRLYGSDVWLATTVGVFVCPAESTTRCVQVTREYAGALLITRERRLWIGGERGIQIWTLDGTTLAAGPERLEESWRPSSLIEDSRGGVLATTYDGRLIGIRDRTSRILFQSENTAQINSVLEDSAANLWLMTSSGLRALRRQGVTRFSTRHGLREPRVRTVFSDAAGHLYALSDGFWLHRLDGDRLSAARLKLPPGVRPSIWAKTIRVDRNGDVWFGTAHGLYRYSGISFSPDHPREYDPTAGYTVADGLAGNHISGIYEDRRGDLWIGSVASGPDTLTVWRRASGRFEPLGSAIGLPAFNQPSDEILEDARGVMWIPLREGGLARVANGRATVLGATQGLPALLVSPLQDRQGRLWFGGADAIIRIDDPAAEIVKAQTVISGLRARALTLKEDAFGTIYAATQAGLFTIDPQTGRQRYYSSFDGLPSGDVETLAKGADGTMLLVAGRSLVRLSPARDGSAGGTPRCYITALRVAGRPQPVPEIGADQLQAFDVPPTQNHVEIEFVALSRQIGEALTYQYRMTGVSNDWMPADQHRLIYAGLAPGRYQFEVRAIGADGSSVSSPAQVAFTVIPPWYRQWWFLTACAAGLVALAYTGHRTRLAQVVRTEQLRSRIATDLHDDVGASLSQIAILAEVTRRRAGSADGSITQPLAAIATTSRDLVDAMSDIVWAVNPRTDSLADLTRRMRRFADETLGAVDIMLDFAAPTEDIALKLGADLRREIYLILKESVTNIARHSGASKARVELQLTRHELRLSIADNGQGFDTNAGFDGNGIASMRKRVAQLGGDLSISSAPGFGTHVTLRVTLHRSRFDPTQLRSVLGRLSGHSSAKDR